MTVSLVVFMSEFPEFEEAESGHVQARLDQAHRAFSPDVLGDHYDDAVRYKAADLLAASPNAKSLRLDKGNGPSIYREHLDRILAGVPSTGVVIDLGACP